MPLSEFEIIERYFAGRKVRRHDVTLGIGDDCAIIRAPQEGEMVVSIDALVEGIHFPEGATPYDIGYKALATSLSDIAAMGATPMWAMLALILQDPTADWLDAFCQGYDALLDRFDMDLIGGNIARGPLSVTSQVQGSVRTGEGLRRAGARPGDRIYVTGTLGDAGLGLRAVLGNTDLPAEDLAFAVRRFYRPEPRVAEGQAMVGIAHAAIDISDGLVADLRHVLESSQVGASVSVDRLPLSSALVQNATPEEGRVLALSAGEDYELCFTVPPEKASEVARLTREFSCGLTEIGVIEERPGLRLTDQGRPYQSDRKGWEHFREGNG